MTGALANAPASSRRHPDGLAAAIECRIPGCCIFCERPLHGKQRLVCGDRACWTSYHSARYRDRPRWVRRRLTLVCGCGRRMPGRAFGNHRRACLYTAAAWPELVLLPRCGR